MIELAKIIRKRILKMCYTSGSSHIGSALSIVEILITLYFRTLRINPQNPEWCDRDRFILGKGHASVALYAVLSERGFFDKKLLDSFYIDNGTLPGHLVMDMAKGIEVSSGSLGHGLPIGTGMAIVGKHDKKDYRVFVLMSDGECDEGSVWESAMLAGHLKLDNLVVIIDYNKLQSFGRVKDVIDLEPFADKWRSFGWSVIEVNGHNVQELTKVFNIIPLRNNKPSVIIAHTVKGKGISFMEDKLEWHYKSPNKEQYEMAIKEIDA